MSAPKDRRRHAHNYCVLARQRADEGRLEEARRYLARAGRLDPANTDVRRTTAAVSYAVGDMDAAERDMDRLYRSPMRDATTCHLLGNIHLARDQAGRALDLYREAAALGGDGPELCYNRALALYLLADLDRAEAEFAAALEFDPDYGRAMDGMGCLERARGRLESATAWFEAAAEADPALPEAQEHLGEALYEAGIFDQAEEHLERAEALDPGRPNTHRLLGEVHAARNQWRQALLHWQRATEAAPDSDEALRGTARALMALGQPDDARRYLEQSLDVNPENVRARVDLGTLYLDTGQLQEALEHLRHAERLAGDNPQIALLIDRALSQSG